MKVIKICGLTEENQARHIAQIGATHLGVIFFEKSPRHISIEKIKSIKQAVSDLDVKVVAVVVNPDDDTVEKLLNIVDIVQLHGEEDLNFLKLFEKDRLLKAIRIKDENSLKDVEMFYKAGFTVLVDAFSKDAYGGTGKQIDKELLKKVKTITNGNFILSGGLSPENVGNLVKEFRPMGVDASSKLEVAPGIKDLDKVKEFIDTVKELG